MKGFWIIVIMIVILVPLIMFSREENRQGAVITKKNLVGNEENEITEIPDLVENNLYESKTKFRMHMKSIDEFDDALAVSIERQNWDDISKYAMLLKNTSPLIYTGKKKSDLPKEFIILDTMFHLQTLAVVEASESREMVKMNMEYEKLQKTCDDCHEKYKNEG